MNEHLSDSQLNATVFEPCPFCGHVPLHDNIDDSLHPVDRERKVWQFGCLANEGGCDSFVLGDSEADVVAKWNKRFAGTQHADGSASA